MEYLLNPKLLKEIKKYGKFDVKGCYNCGTCPVVCNLSKDFASFPRRPIQYALIGSKELVLKSIEAFLCHDCGDCSISCPRETEPRLSMATLRRYLISKYDITRIASKILSSKIVGIASYFIVAILSFLIIFLYHYFKIGLSPSDFFPSSMPVEHILPEGGFRILKGYALFVILFPLLILLIGVIRMGYYTFKGEKVSFGSFFVALYEIIVNMLTQKDMLKCAKKENKIRYIFHIMMALGCLLMLIIVLFLLRWKIYTNLTQRILGYLSTLGMLAGSIYVLFERIFKKGEEIYKKSEWQDYPLPILLLLISLSGILVHILRNFETEMLTHYINFFHVAVVTSFLLIELPFGKLSHLIYRPFAIYFYKVKEISYKRR
ncbi:MAG: 4Fe-4S dicluster domain-containing protein [candidate division WOR-3 bacterium]